MDPKHVMDWSVQYGLGIVLSVGMACFLSWILKYVLMQNQIREERLSSLISKDIATNALAIEKNTKAIEEHDNRSNLAVQSLSEAHRRQREEHEAHRKILENIEQENVRRREAQIEIVQALKSINESLSELNKKDVYFQKKGINAPK